MKAAAESTPGLSHSARNQAQPAATKSGPTAFPRRLPQNTRPQASNAQPAPSRATAPPSDEPANEAAGPSRAIASEKAPSASPAGKARAETTCANRRTATDGRPPCWPLRQTRAAPCLRPGVEGAPRCAESTAAVASKAPTRGGARRCRRDDSWGGRWRRCSLPRQSPWPRAAARAATRPAEPTRPSRVLTLAVELACPCRSPPSRKS